MADETFNTTANQVIDRELLIAYVKVNTNYLPLGTRVPDSSEGYDWQDETEKDILGNTWNTMKKPIITQSFDPLPLIGADTAIEHIWNLAVKDQNAAALAAQDMLIVHKYAGTADTPFAEHYTACAVKPTGLGGEGGAHITMPIDVTYGGEREIGTVSYDAQTGAVTFTAAQ
jgi:hypothetical protein